MTADLRPLSRLQGFRTDALGILRTEYCVPGIPRGNNFAFFESEEVETKGQ